MISKLHCAADCSMEPPIKEIEVQPSEYRVLVSGWRNLMNQALVWYELDKVHHLRRITTIIHGGARGADAIAHGWAVTNNILTSMYPALWKDYGKAAGPIRNQQMLDEARPDLVVAFLSPKSVGTLDMLASAKKVGVQTYTVIV